MVPVHSGAVQHGLKKDGYSVFPDKELNSWPPEVRWDAAHSIYSGIVINSTQRFLCWTVSTPLHVFSNSGFWLFCRLRLLSAAVLKRFFIILLIQQQTDMVMTALFIRLSSHIASCSEANRLRQTEAFYLQMELFLVSFRLIVRHCSQTFLILWHSRQ